MARSVSGVNRIGDRWYATAYDPKVRKKVRVKNPSTGRTAFATQEDAVAAKEEFERTKDTANRSWTVADWAREWTTNTIYERPKASTNAHNTYCVSKLIRDMGDLPLDGITPNAAREWAHANQHRMGAVRAMFNEAVREGLITANPFSNLRLRQSRGRKDIKPLTVEEVGRLIDIANDLYPDWPSMSAMITTAAFAGLRIGELCGLKWEDVNWEAGMIHVDRQLGVGRVFELPKNGRTRKVPMLDVVAQALRDLPRANKDGMVFYSRKAHGMYYTQLHSYFWSSVRAAFFTQLPPDRQEEIGAGFAFHELRHFCGSYLADNGVSAQDIAFQLGHEDGGRLAQELYIHTYDNHAADRIRRAMNPLTSGRVSGRAAS